MIKRICLLLLTLCLSLISFAQTKDEVRPLLAGPPVEREIAGGDSHTYQINLAAGQFVHLRLDQQKMDSVLILTAPDGKQVAEVNLTDAGESESFALETLVPGTYRLTVRGNGGATMGGAYRLEATVQATPTAQDRKRLVAQTHLLEAQELAKQFPKTAPQAIEKLDAALPVWRELGDSYRVALTFDRLGRAHLSLNQFEKAIASYEQALAIHREVKNRLGEAVILYSLATAYFNRRQFEKAREVFESSLSAYREVKDRRWEGLVLHSLARTYSGLNRSEKAIEYYEQALTILREVNDRNSEGRALLSFGNLYLNQGQSEKAIAITVPALAIFREVKDRSAEGLALNNLGIVYGRIGESDKAIDNLNQALTRFRELKQRPQEADALNSLGSVYGGMGQTEKAIEYFEQGLGVNRELNDKQRESRALSNLGLAYAFLSQYEKSIEYLEQSLTKSRELNDRRLEGIAYNNLAVSYAGLSRFEKAIECHEQALSRFREVKYLLGEGNTLQFLGSTYAILGRDDKAAEYYQQTLAIFRETKYRVGEADVLSNLGDVHERQGRHAEAIRAEEQALSIYRELKYQLGEGIALRDLGVTYANTNQHERALELYEQALPILREAKSRENEGLTLLRMGESKQKLARTTEAAGLLTQAAAVLKAIGSRSGEFAALTALARTERAGGSYSKARTTVEESLRIAESLRSELVSQESRATFLADVQGTYQLYTDLLMQLHKAEPTKGLDARAVEVSERQRARSLLDLLTEARADVRQGVDAALLDRERLVGRQLNDKAQRLTQTSKPEQAAALKLEISQLENDYERAQAAIRKSSPHYAGLTQPQPLKLNEIQAQLDADTLLLEYALGEDRSYLWAITKDSLKSYELPKGEQIKQIALRVSGLLTARSENRRGESNPQRLQRIARADAALPVAALELSRTLLTPVATQLGNKRLVIVADGALQYIPFSMLPDPEGRRQNAEGSTKLGEYNQPLIVKHEVVSLPSASALAIQRTELAGRQPAPKTLAVIADPVFDRTDARFKTATATTSEKEQVQELALNRERTLEHLAEKTDDPSGLPTRRLVIPRLPFTREEATRLLALTAKNSSLGAMDFQASRAMVLGGDLSQYRYVHFATHGVLDSERPGLSSLVLSMLDAEGKAQDGFLRANDIYNLKLPAELVVLSACQTGLGKEIRGEGLVGLTRGFMYAGAARVVMSLWSVNDKATAELMTRFYEKMLKQGERPAAALRAAQVEMWKQKQWQSPYYWAAFSMQGEWR
jgi:CHAT domain-containing protein/uncharacterized protein HemY